MKADLRDATDEQLLRQSGAGASDAFGVLVDRHADRLYRLAASLVGNAADAEDVLQEALAGAYRGAKTFAGRSSVKTWLTKILLTQAALWRRQASRRRSGRNSAECEVTSGINMAEQVGTKIDLNAALLKLTPEHREVLVLREFEMMPYDEIATVLGVPAGTVESRLHRARLELRRALASYLA